MIDKKAAEFLKKGEIFLDLKEFHRARIMFDQVVNLCPQDYRGWFGLAQAITELGEVTDENACIKYKSYMEKAIKYSEPDRALRLQIKLDRFLNKAKFNLKATEEVKVEEDIEKISEPDIIVEEIKENQNNNVTVIKKSKAAIVFMVFAYFILLVSIGVYLGLHCIKTSFTPGFPVDYYSMLNLFMQSYDNYSLYFFILDSIIVFGVPLLLFISSILLLVRGPKKIRSSLVPMYFSLVFIVLLGAYNILSSKGFLPTAIFSYLDHSSILLTFKEGTLDYGFYIVLGMLVLTFILAIVSSVLIKKEKKC